MSHCLGYLKKWGDPRDLEIFYFVPFPYSAVGMSRKHCFDFQKLRVRGDLVLTAPVSVWMYTYILLSAGAETEVNDTVCQF